MDNNRNINDQSNTANCGWFWLANSIVSTIMQSNNLSLHEEVAQRNLDFQRQLEDARNIAQDEIEAEKIAFTRRMMQLSRQHRQIESEKSFKQQLDKIELEFFIKNYWPLDERLPWIIKKGIEQSKQSDKPLPLNVVLLHAPLLPFVEAAERTNYPQKENKIYKELEYRLRSQLRALGDVDFHENACTKTDYIGGNANLMNIHFIMGSLPTLVISPKYSDGKMNFSSAVWEAQATSPLIRPLFSISYDIDKTKDNEEYFKQAIEKFETALAVIVGTTRDSYMLLTQGIKPMLNELLSKKQKELVAEDKTLRSFVKQEYNNIVNALDTKHTPKLLEAYSEKDVEIMKLHAHNMSLTFQNK